MRTNARRMRSGRDLGSLSWFLDGLKLDLEVFARSLAQTHAPAQPEAPTEPPPTPTDTPPDPQRSQFSDAA